MPSPKVKHVLYLSWSDVLLLSTLATTFLIFASTASKSLTVLAASKSFLIASASFLSSAFLVSSVTVSILAFKSFNACSTNAFLAATGSVGVSPPLEPHPALIATGAKDKIPAIEPNFKNFLFYS